MRRWLDRLVAAALGGGLLFTVPHAARAQIVFEGTGGNGAVCAESSGEISVATGSADCDDGAVMVTPTALVIGPAGSDIVFDPATGDATFGGTTAFNGATSFAQGTTFGGAVSAAGLTSTSGISNTGAFSNTGTFTNTGNVTVNGELGATNISSGTGTFSGGLSSSQLVTGGISASTVGTSGAITAGGFLQGNAGASIFGTTQLVTVQVTQGLSVAGGATIDMNGNRITEVGTPVDGTDAANKNYVDGLAGAAQTTANLALANAATAQASADAAQATADTGLARTGALGAGTAAALGGGASYNATTGALSAPSYSIAGESYGNVGAAFEAVDEELEMLDTRLGNLTEATERGFRRANGGIATALALGGTMIVPDSTVSMSFNLATYRGEQGFSGAVVIQAAPKVYISGGVAGSTVKGSTGGRVGVAFGL